MTKSDETTTIPVAFATDATYAFPYLAAVQSLFDTCPKNTQVKLYTIIPDDFPREHIDIVFKMAANFNMPEPIFLYPNQEYNNAHMNIGHTTKATYYRLDLPSLLKSESKCIYLDCDVIVTSDITELFEIDIDDQYLAGVKAAGYYYPEKRQQSLANSLGIEAFDQYVNAGVLLMNLELMRKDGVESKFEKLLSKGFDSQDQDIINVACYGKIRTLPPKFNLMVKYHPEDPLAYENVNGVNLAWTEYEWKHACGHPVVVHYADAEKPWDSLMPELSEIWWVQCGKLERSGYAPSLRSVLLPVIGKLDNQRILFAESTERSWQQVQDLHHSVENHQQMLNEIYSSTTWKVGRFVTAPLRWLKRIIVRSK